MKLLGKNKNEQIKKESNEKMPLNKKYLRNGSYSTLLIVIFVAIVVVINMIVGKLPSKYTQIDISDQQLYSIGDETKKVLNNLDKDVPSIRSLKAVLKTKLSVICFRNMQMSLNM